MTGSMSGDIRWCFRRIRRDPIFTVSAMAILAVAFAAFGIASTLVKAVLVPVVAASDPSRLLIAHSTDRTGAQTRLFDYGLLADLSSAESPFETSAGYMGGAIYTLQVESKLMPATVEGVTATYFKVFPATPAQGRWFNADEEREAIPVGLLSYRFWRDRLGKTSILGSTVLVEDSPVTVIGIAPEHYRGIQSDQSNDLIVPLPSLRKLGTTNPAPVRFQYLAGVMKPGRPSDAAVQAINQSLASAAASARDSSSDVRVIAEGGIRGVSRIRAQYATALSVAFALTVLLLLIATVNLSGLLVLRWSARQAEVATLRALGASPSRLVWTAFLETAMIVLPSIATGAVVGWWVSLPVAESLWTGLFPPDLQLSPDSRLIAFYIAAAAATTALLAWPQAYLVTRPSIVDHLRTRTNDHSRRRLSRSLLAIEVAIAATVLFIALTLASTVQRILDSNLGFDPTGVLWARVTSQPGGYRHIDPNTYLPTLTSSIAALHGAQAVALAHFFPTTWTLGDEPFLRAVRASDGKDGAASVSAFEDRVSPGFFATLGVSVLRGRDFDWHDSNDKRPVVIISETLERQLFPSGNSVGHLISIADGDGTLPCEIIAVVRDARVGGIRSNTLAAVYKPLLQRPTLSRVPVIVVRVDPASIGFLTKELPQTVSALGHEYVLLVRSLSDQYYTAVAKERFVSNLGLFFALMSVVLTGIGTYSLVGYSARLRRTEIAVRVAVGATPRALVWTLLREAVGPAVAGLSLAIPLSVGLLRTFASFIPDVTVSAVALGAVAGTMLLIAAAASAQPIRSATEVSPADALRGQ